MNYSGRCAPPRVKPLLEDPFGDDLAAVPMLRGHYVLNLHRDLPTGTWRSLPMMGIRGSDRDPARPLPRSGHVGSDRWVVAASSADNRTDRDLEDTKPNFRGFR